MGFRFKRILKILPGVRVNVSKGGLSTSLGVPGADINIGKRGITTNAGIPGTGLSWRQKLGSKGSWIGVVTLIAGMAYAGYNYLGSNQAPVQPRTQTQAAAVTPPPSIITAPVPRATAKKEPLKAGMRYVRRNNSVLRAEAKANGKALAHKEKGAAVKVLSISQDGWAEVQDGTVHGFMRASVLGEPPTP